MTVTVVRRLNASMYALINTEQVTNPDVDLLISKVKIDVNKTGNEHCLILEDGESVRCFYVGVDMTVNESDTKPRGGFFVKQKT